jgi:hypothetical protein
MMARARAASLFVVSRAAPSTSRWSEEPEFYVTESEGVGSVPLCGFATQKVAEAERAKLERAARESTPIGPFLRGLLPDRMSAVTKAARAAKLPPPDFGAVGPPVGPTRDSLGQSWGQDYFDYSERVQQAVGKWWESVAPTTTPEANATLWDKLFPEFHFYVVTRALFEE